MPNYLSKLFKLLVEMSDKEKLDRRPIYTPRKFVNTVWTSLNFWSDGSQQDAHEVRPPNPTIPKDIML